MKYSTGGKINNGDTLSYLEAVNAELTELESKRNVRIKFGLDAKDQKRAEELLDTFNDKSKNGMNNYFVTARKGLNDLKNAYGDLLDTESAMKRSNDNAEIGKLQKKYDQQVNDVVRLANAYQALGYQVKDKDKEIYDSILKVASAQEKLLQKKSGGSYQYTIKNFKELFDVMKELNELLEDNTGLSKNFAPFQLQLQDIESIEKKAKKAEQHLDKVWKKYGNKQLPSETRDSVIKNKAVIDVYRGAHKSITKEDYNASEGFQHFREMDIGEGYRDLDVYRETYSNLKGEYDTILSKMRKSCLKAAEKAQEEMLSGYGAISRDVEKKLYDGLIKQIDDAKKRVAYLEAEQAEKIASEFSSFENTSPKFARDKQTAGAYITNESYTKASQLYDSLFDQIEQEAISADEAIKIMAKDLVNAVAKGEANPFLTDSAIASQEEIEKLLAKIKDLQEELQKAKDDADAWSESAYRNFDEKLGLESEVNKLRKDLEDKNDEIEGLQKNVNNLHETISILEDENEDLQNNKSSSDTGIGEYEKTLESYQSELGQAYSDLNQAMNKIAQMSLNMQDGQEGNFEGCCEALKSIQQILQGFDLSAFQDFPNFAETVKNTLETISQSVKTLEDVFTSADGGKITVNATTNMTLGGNDDPAMRQRAKELQSVFDRIFEEHQFRKSIKNVNNGLGLLETELENYEHQLESLYERRKTATKEDAIAIDRMIASLEDTIEIQKQSIKRVSELKPQQTTMTKHSISMTDLYGIMINTIPKLKQKYNGDIDAFMSAYSGQAISKLSAADKVDKLEELLGWIGELPKYKKTIDEDTAKVITKYVSTELSQLSSSQQQESKLGISDTIDQILKNLQHIVQQLSKIQDIMGGDISNDIPNLKSDFLSERGTNLKNLFNQIGKKKGTDTFSTAKNNLDAIKNFLKQFHEYGNGEWSLDEFARINGISDKNLKILQQYNEELLSQGEIVPKLKREEKVVKEVVEAEKSQFKELSDSIGEVTVAEQKKTQVFQEEEQQTEKVTKKTTKRKSKKKAVEEEVPEQQEKKTVYVDDKKKLKQTLMMERQVSNLLYNNNLNGDARKDMENLLATLKVVETTTGMTRDEWEDIQLIVTDLTNKAKTNINENKKLAQQEKEQAKANRDKLKSEKEREKLLKEENEAKAEGQVAPKKSAKQTLDISQMSTNVETAASSLTGIQQDVSSIKNDVGALRKDTTPETSNELSNALKGWVEASNIMAKEIDSDINPFDGREYRDDKTLDRERKMYGDLKTGRITNPYLVGEKAEVPMALATFSKQLADLFEEKIDIHSHPDDYVAPSGMNGDLGYYLQTGEKQALIIGRKQMMLINNAMLDTTQQTRVAQEYDRLRDNNYHSYEQKVLEEMPEFANNLQKIISATDGEEQLSKFAEGITGILNSVSKAEGNGIPINSGYIEKLIKEQGLNFELDNQESYINFLTQLFSKKNFGDLYSKVRENTIDMASSSNLFLRRTFFPDENPKIRERNIEIKASQLILEDAYKNIIGDNKFGEYAKYLNYENPEQLTVSAINDFLGVQNTRTSYLEDISSTIKQILSILSSGNVSLSKSDKSNRDEFTTILSAPKKKNSGWYGGYAEDMLKRNLNYSNIFDEDLQRYKSSIGQTGKSDLEYMTQFFKEYEDYFRRLAEATDDKDLRKKLKDYSSFIKEQRTETLNALKLKQEELEKRQREEQELLDAEALIYANQQADEFDAKEKYYENEKNRIEREAQEKRDLEAFIYANQQADEYDAQERYYETEKAKWKQKEQERLEYEALLYANQQGDEFDAEQKYYEAEKERARREEQERQDLDALIYANQQASEYDARERYYETEKARFKQEEQDRLDLEASIYAFNQSQEYDAIEEYYETTRKRFQDEEKARVKAESEAIKRKDSIDEKDRDLLRQVQNQKATQTEKNFNQGVGRDKKLQDIIDEVEKLYNSPDYTLRFKDEELSGFLNAIKEVRVQTSLTEEELENINKAYKEIKDSAKASAKEQSELNDLADKFDKIMTKKNNEDSLFYTKDYLDIVNDARSRLKAGTLGVEEGRSIYAGISDPNNIVGSSKSLNNYIRRGQQLIAQNYMPGNLKKQFEELVEAMQKVSKEGGHSRTEINKMVGAFQELDIEAAKAGKTLFGQIGQRLQDMNAKFIAQYFSFMDIVRYTRTMISTITELDTALTEMRKVSDESVKSLKEYQKTTFDTAGALGTTAVQLQQSTADWLRLGESMDEASKSAQAATTLFNVSEFDNINEATTALVAMSQAYKDMDKTEIIDVMNNIGNNYAIATDELATALQASAASLMTQGNDLYEAAALVTAGNQIIQDADKVGTGLRTISLRIAGVKEGDDDIKKELEELGEEVDDWVVATQAKKRQVILDYTKTASNGGMGVDILDSNGNLRDTYHILLDIAKVYKEIQEEDKKYGTNRAKGLVEELAGKNRSNIAASILMNPELLEDVYNSALDSAGSAAEENAKYLDSIVGKTQQFKNELQELESNIINSEWIKDIIDFGTQILSIVNKLGKGLPVIVAGIGSIAAAMGLLKDKTQGILKFDAESGSLGIGRFDIGKAISKETANIEEIYTKPVLQFGEALKDVFSIDFNNKDLKLFYDTIGNDTPVENAIELLNDYDDEVQKMGKQLISQGVDSQEKFAQATEETSAASKAAAVGVSILNTALMSIATFAISWAITKIVEGFKALANAEEDAAENAIKFNDSVKETRETLRDNAKFLAENGEEFTRLAKEVDSFGNNISLSSDEFKRYNELANAFGDMYPELVKGWTKAGDAIIYNKESLEGLNEAYDENRKRQLQKLILGTSDEEVGPEAFFKDWSNFDGPMKASETDYEYLLGLSKEELAKLFNVNMLTATPEQRRVSETVLRELRDKDVLNPFIDKNTGHFTISDDDYEAALTYIRAQLSERQAGYNQRLGVGKNILSAYLELQPEYDDLDKTSQDLAQKIVNSLDENIVRSFKGDPNKMNAYARSILEGVNSLSEQEMKDLLSIDINESSLSDTSDKIQQAWEKVVSKVKNEDVRNELWEALGFSDIEDTKNRLEQNVSSLTGSDADIAEARALTSTFSAEQAELWLNIVSYADDARDAVDAYNKALEEGYSTAHKYESIGALLSQKSYVESGEAAKQFADAYNEELEKAMANGVDFNKLVYGNIDTNNRQVLEWTKDTIEKYRKAIESYGDSANDYLGSISTVDAMSAEFDGVEIAFTPMLQTPNGAEYLDKDTMYRYIQALVDQMPEGWTNEDLFALDAKGIEIDGKIIKNMIADIGESAIKTAENMHYLGENGSLNLLKKEMQGVGVTWKDVQKDLVGLAQAGKLDEQTLRDYKYFNEILKALGLTADVTDEQLQAMINDINKLAVKNAVDDLSNYKTEVDKLGDAYSKFKKGEFIDAGTLSALQDAFGDLDSYQAFEEAVLSGEQDLQHYFDDIVTEYANQHKILNELTDANKEWVKQQLVASGITKESADAAVEDALKHKKALEDEVRAEIESLNSMDAIANGKKELAIDTANLDKVTIDEVNAILAETKATGEGVEALKYFAIEKELAKMTGIRNNDDIDYLIQLCELAGMGTSQLESLKRLGANSDKWVSQISEADAHLKQLGSRSDPGAVNERAYWNQIKRDAQNAQQKYAQGLNEALPNFREEFQKQYGKFQYDFSSGLDFSGVTDAAGEAGSEAAEAFKDALDKILAMYDAELDAGVITFQTYVDKSRQAIEQYYNEGKIKASEYYDYLANLYQKQVSEYDKVISAVQRLLKKQTDELQKQKEAIEESYNLQIEEIQKKIDALRDENDEIDKNMALQKAQYNLARAQNQRTKLMYSESRGFYYEADLKGVHDAQEEVRKAQLDKTIFDLEKQIKVLQDQMKKETDEIDKQIKALNEYAEAWGEVSSKLQNAIEDQRAAQILGQDWEKQILDQRLDTLQNFTNQYVALQQAQKDAYLAARQAEANAALSGGGSTVTKTVRPDNTNDDNNKNKTPIVTQPGGSQGATHWKIQPSPPTSYYGQNITSSLGQLSGFTDPQNASMAANSLPAKIATAAKNAASMSSDPSIKYLQGQARTNKLNQIYNEVLSEQKKKGYRAQSYFTGTDSAKSGEALVGEKGHEIVVGNDGIATIVNEPTLMKMQGGEKVFNADETDKILKKSVPLKKFNPKKFALLQSFANGTSSPMQTRIAAQAVGLANGLSTGMLNVQGAGGQTINQTFNVSLPNITDQSKASELFKEFEHMQMKATQFFNR